MKLPFFGSRDDRRAGVATTGVRTPALRRKKSAPALSTQPLEAPEAFPDRLRSNLEAHKAKPQWVANLVQAVSTLDNVNKFRRASKLVHPASSYGLLSREVDVKPLEIASLQITNEDVERIMGKPKAETASSVTTPDKARTPPRLKRCPEEHVDRTPLSSDELQQMFDGAPHFGVMKGGSGYQPRVHHVGKLPPKWPISSANDTTSHATTDDDTSLHADVDRDLGAISFATFLQWPLSHDEGASTQCTGDSRRELLYTFPEQLGLKSIALASNVDRLSELSLLHASLSQPDQAPSESLESVIEAAGEDLFTRLICHPVGSDCQDYSLRQQIETLQAVLDTSNLWHDFSCVDSRARLGQVFTSREDVPGSTMPPVLDPKEQEMLLLQLTLASELLVRLEMMRALSHGSSIAGDLWSKNDRMTGESECTEKLHWDLTLAERCLADVEILLSPLTQGGDGHSSWITLSARPSLSCRPRNRGAPTTEFLAFAESLHWPGIEELRTLLTPTHAQGGSPVSEVRSTYLTPLQTPIPSDISDDEDESAVGYSPAGKLEQRGSVLVRRDTGQSVTVKRPSALARPSSAKTIENLLHRSWLDRVLMLGDTASQHLVRSLISSNASLRQLNELPRLSRGGFVFGGRSFWNETTVVGRVMAASSGASGSMGWVSTPNVPECHEGIWIESAGRETLDRKALARIIMSEAVARDSAPTGRYPPVLASKQDFKYPTDGLLVLGNEVRLDGSRLTYASDTSSSPTMVLKFASPINSKLDKLEVPLIFDVHFVSSYPCHPTTKEEPKSVTNLQPGPAPERQRPTSAMPAGVNASSIRLVPSGLEEPSSRVQEPLKPLQKRAPDPKAKRTTALFTFGPAVAWPAGELSGALDPPSAPAHALHDDFKFETFPVATLLSTPPPAPSVSETPLTRPNPRQSLVLVSGFDKAAVTVLDCRGAADLQLLARAWCAMVGEHALVSKVGRTCVACSVREARALGMGVVIRIS